MNREVKQRWVEALRSGEYPQCRARLRRWDGYCCLGVLCDIYAKEKDVSWGKRPLFDEAGYDFLGATDTPPNYVMDWSGLDLGMVRHLVQMNDGGDSFLEIADWIEEFDDIAEYIKNEL